jgi:hypothetical protein
MYKKYKEKNKKLLKDPSDKRLNLELKKSFLSEI